MATNKNGFKAGSMVPYAELKKYQREQQEKAKGKNAPKKPKLTVKAKADVQTESAAQD